jgi:hypothetical protein
VTAPPTDTIRVASEIATERPVASLTVMPPALPGALNQATATTKLNRTKLFSIEV